MNPLYFIAYHKQTNVVVTVFYHKMANKYTEKSWIHSAMMWWGYFVVFLMFSYKGGQNRINYTLINGNGIHLLYSTSTSTWVKKSNDWNAPNWSKRVVLLKQLYDSISNLLTLLLISHESEQLKCLYASTLLQTDVTYDLICLHRKTLSLQQRWIKHDRFCIMGTCVYQTFSVNIQ